MDETGERFGANCPRCGDPIDGSEGACPNCDLTFLDDAGQVSDDAIQAMLDNAGVSRPGGRGGMTYTPAWIRLLVGLAITVPLAPVVVLLVLAVQPLPIWAAVILLTGSWLGPGYLLARWRVPTRIVANGLLTVGVTMTVGPLAVIALRTLFGTPEGVGALGTNVYAARFAFVLIGVAIVGVGLFVRRHAIATQMRWEAEDAAPPEQ